MEPVDQQPPAPIAPPPWLTPQALRKVIVGLLFFIGWTWLVIRFVGLSVSPPGFFMDEATPAIHAMCLAEVGTDSEGHPWPLYAHAAGGGSHTLALLAFEIVWIKFFGTSRASFRAVAGFWFLVTACGLFFFARTLSTLNPAPPEDEAGQQARQAFPWLVLLAALVSPWAFQFSRIGWDPPVAPAYMVWSLVGVLRAHRGGRRAIVWSVFAGFAAAMSMIAYAPLRAVEPLVLGLLIGCLLVLDKEWRQRWKLVRRLVVTAMVAAVCLVPTVRMMAQGTINERLNNIAIWRPDWMREHAGATPKWIFLIETFLDNMWAHLRPSFLFITGDTSLRHSPQISGHLSPLDMLALALAAGVAMTIIYRSVCGRVPLPGLPGMVLSPSSRLLFAVAIGALASWLFALVPAALTFDAIPHAIRAIGAWPFVVLLSGAVLALAWAHWKWLPPVLALVAVAHTLYYLPAYFHAYDKAPNHWFMRDMTDVLEKETKEKPPKTVQQIVSDHFGYSYYYDEVPRFYLMSEAGMGCVEARLTVRKWRDRENGK